MKIVSPFFLKKVSNTEIIHLIRETKEGLDIPLKKEVTRKFHRVDLWKVTNQKRVFCTRRFI
jgi:hypothetical protein